MKRASATPELNSFVVTDFAPPASAAAQPRGPAVRPFPALAGYYLVAFACTWGWQIPLFTGALPWGAWALLGPTAAGLIMAGAADGAAGVAALLRRTFTWRVGLHWYAVSLLLIPAIYTLNVAILPGGLDALRAAPLAAIGASFVHGLWPSALSALFWEEVGWRGFAQPRMLARFGPLRGTLLLGVMWGLWHLTLWAFNPSVRHNIGAAWLGILLAYLLYVCSTMAFSVFFVWIMNHARGSVLLAVLLHATINASLGTFNAYFPALSAPTVQAVEILVAALIVVATRGRLGSAASTCGQHRRAIERTELS